jgi:hypothetical protein
MIIFVVFATRYQNEKPLFGEDPRHQAIMIVYFVSFFFYLVASYVCFRSYREFKAIAYEIEGLAAPPPNNA